MSEIKPTFVICKQPFCKHWHGIQCILVGVCVSLGRTKDRKFLFSQWTHRAFRLDKNQLHARPFSKAISSRARVISRLFVGCVREAIPIWYTRENLSVLCVRPVPDRWNRESEIDSIDWKRDEEERETRELGEEMRLQAPVMDRPISAARWNTRWERTRASTYRLAQDIQREEWREEVMVGALFD